MERRKYLDSHPWLTFTLDLKRAQAPLWIALGEAQSKCHHIAGVPMQPGVAYEMHRLYLARGLLATTAIEGNTLTEDEVRALLDKKLKLPPSRQYLAKEIDNVLHACNRILGEIEARHITPITTALIKEYNRLVLQKLESAREVLPGEIRKHAVGVGNYRGAPAEDCEHLLDQLCEWLNNGFRCPDENRVIFGLIKSIVAHVYLAWIHPFGDGNGRTARLLEVKFLMEAGVPSPAAHLLSNHYNLTRAEYYRQLDQTSKSIGNLLPFIQYAVIGFVDQLREQIEKIKSQQLLVSWINYVHDRFGGLKTAPDRRQRDVVLAMPAEKFIKASDVRELTPGLATQYATKTRKTVTRDLNRLKKLGLVESHNGTYRANINVMLAFLPISLGNHAPESDMGSPDLETGNEAATDKTQRELPLSV